MINLTKLWTGVAQPADGLRYGHGAGGNATEARARRPITVWNITRTCNLRCVHCYSDSNAQQYPGELTWEQMEQVVEDLAAYQVPSLLFSGGEPMIHPRFFDLVDKATAMGLKLTISTNGTLITPEKAALLKAANVAYVGISLDGIGPIHDQFRRKEGAFDAAVRGFRNCHAVDQKTGLRLTLTRHNVENINQILDFIEDQEIQRVCFYHLVPAGRGSELQVLAPEEARGAIDTLIARVEAWHRQGVERELLNGTAHFEDALLGNWNPRASFFVRSSWESIAVRLPAPRCDGHAAGLEDFPSASVRTRLVAKRLRRHALDVLEDAREIALVAEATGIGDFRQRQLGAAQQITGEVHAALAQQLGERAAGALFEQAREMARRNPRVARRLVA